MKGVYLTVFLTVFMCIFLATGTEEPQCFYFTWWPGATDSDRDHCEDHDNPFTPCIGPVVPGRDPPNLDEILKKNKSDCVRPMESGTVCIKYTYVYNGAVVNVSYFPGKVTEDQTTPIISGCYVQYAEGYSIEACVCHQSKNGKPCNSTIRNTYSLLIIFVTAAVSLFMYKIFEIP